LLAAAHDSWNKVLENGEQYGFRNAQTTVIAPTGTIGLVMDCDTTGVEPDYALVKFKKLAGGGFFKIVNQSVPKALKRSGYSEEQVKEIIAYCLGHGTLQGSPFINKESLTAKGFNEEQLLAVEQELKSAMDIRFVFNSFTLGQEFYDKMIGNSTDLLTALGFTNEQIYAANEYVSGTMTLEGAPHLKEEHMAMFDCANTCGKKGKRYIHPYGHLKMVAAVQTFISGAISKTINMPTDWTVQQIKDAYYDAWKMMTKAVALYRDGCKLSQPLNTTLEDSPELKKILAEPLEETNVVVKKAQIGSHELTLSGTLDEGKIVSLDVSMPGSTPAQEAMTNALVGSVNVSLQNGLNPSLIAAGLNVEGHPVIKEMHGFLSGFGEEVEAPEVAVQESAPMPTLAEDKESCKGCGATQMRQNGTCMLCEVCGETSGCS